VENGGGGGGGGAGGGGGLWTVVARSAHRLRFALDVTAAAPAPIEIHDFVVLMAAATFAALQAAGIRFRVIPRRHPAAPTIPIGLTTTKATLVLVVRQIAVVVVVAAAVEDVAGGVLLIAAPAAVGAQPFPLDIRIVAHGTARPLHTLTAGTRAGGGIVIVPMIGKR